MGEVFQQKRSSSTPEHKHLPNPYQFYILVVLYLSSKVQ